MCEGCRGVFSVSDMKDGYCETCQISKSIDNIALNVEYKTYSMTSNYGDYDYDRVSTGIKYSFK